LDLPDLQWVTKQMQKADKRDGNGREEGGFLDLEAVDCALRPPTLRDVERQVVALARAGGLANIRAIAVTLMTIASGHRGDQIIDITYQQTFGPGIVVQPQPAPHDPVPVLNVALYKGKPAKVDRKYFSCPQHMNPLLDPVAWLGVYLLTLWSAQPQSAQVGAEDPADWLKQHVFPGTFGARSAHRQRAPATWPPPCGA
jgi:hypothetical protein